MKFEWDDNKNQINIEKHGIDFNDAVDIFNHVMLTKEDTSEAYGEVRWVSIGWLKALVGVIVYTEQIADVTRIISARKATKPQSERCDNMKKVSNTDWNKLAKMKDSDIAELDDDFFKRAEIRVPPKKSVTMRLDADVLEWYKSQGTGYQTRINKLLRSYMDAQLHHH